MVQDVTGMNLSAERDGGETWTRSELLDGSTDSRNSDGL